MIICYTVPEIWRMTDVIFVFNFGLSFALLPPNDPKKQNKIFQKNQKNAWRFHHLTCVPKIMIKQFPRYTA